MHGRVAEHLEWGQPRPCPHFEPVLLHFEEKHFGPVLLVPHNGIPAGVGDNLELLPEPVDHLARYSMRRQFLHIPVELRDLVQFLEVFGQRIVVDHCRFSVSHSGNVQLLTFVLGVDIVGHGGHRAQDLISFGWLLVVLVVIKSVYFPSKITHQLTQEGVLFRRIPGYAFISYLDAEGEYTFVQLQGVVECAGKQFHFLVVLQPQQVLSLHEVLILVHFEVEVHAVGDGSGKEYAHVVGVLELTQLGRQLCAELHRVGVGVDELY